MSAIFGLVNLDGRPVAECDLHRMGTAMAAHGPDGGGVWTSGHVGLGQRLMCFTPEDLLERQPLAGAEGRHVLVMDGRVDNRPELVEALGIPLAEASELPDSAFVLRSYEKWGSDCCGHLVGDFAFALWDSHEKYVLIFRSAMCNRALYFYSAPGRFAFASAPKGLFALPWIPREIDQQQLADHLVLAPRERGRSFFAGVRELQFGQSIALRRDGFQLQQYWQPDISKETRFPRDSDYVEAFTEIFDRVIADHLRSLTPVGVMMSGGLDSSSVGVTAARLLSPQGKRLAAFTEVPRAGFVLKGNKGRYPDETEFVKAIAGKCENLDLNFVRTNGCSLLDGIDQHLDAFERPFRAGWNRMWLEAIMRQARQQNVRVVLTGAPGNLTVSQGGESLLPQLIRDGKWLHAIREAQACSRKNGGASIPGILARGAAPLVPLPLWLMAGRLFRPRNPVFRASPPWRAYSPIHPEFARSHRVEERARQNGHDFHFRGTVKMPADRYESLRRWEPGIQGSRGYEVLFGLQKRNPTADVRLVEFCLSLPEEQYQLNGMSRSLIRRAMQDRLPPEVLANQRRGVQAADWLEGANAGRDGLLDELGRLDHSALASTAIDLKWVRGMLEQTAQLDRENGPTRFNYRTILGMAFMTGSFVRWVECSGAKAS